MCCNLYLSTNKRILSGIPTGTFGRWAFGVIILTHLIAYNETSSAAILIAVLIALINSLLAVFCKNGINQIQMPYLRATHQIDFLCLFLALWMELLGLISVSAALARTVSFSLDAMSGGLVRIYILGRNSSINEPWPDVLGVLIVFIITAMFILGLENSKIFSVLMITGVLSISGLLSVVTYLRGNIDAWMNDDLMPKGLPGILSASALLVIAFPNHLPTGGYPKTKALGLSTIVLISISLIAGCLSTLIPTSKSQAYETVPMLSILEKKDLHKLIPAMACLYILASSGALLEIFPETFKIIVRLATSEWKIMVKQISYESRESGSPVLAVFLSGSLVSILAFACPLENISYIIAGSQLSAGILRALYFLYSPFRPKSIPKQDSTQAYSRLNTGPKPKPSAPKKSKMWFFNKSVPSMSTQSLSKSISKLNNKIIKNEEMEREWLLLGEPSSPIARTSQEPVNAESSILSDATTSDTDCIVKAENTDSDSSEDIDAIVDEYRQKVKVSTAGLRDTNLIMPTVGSWRLALLSIFSIICSSVTAAICLFYEVNIPCYIAFIVVLVISIFMFWIPKYSFTHDTPSIFTCAMSLLLSCILLSAVMKSSWLAVVCWFLSGVIMFIRCDNWCCLCLDVSSSSLLSDHSMEENLIPNTSRHTTTTIRLKNPPKGSSVINHIQTQRR
ncbi:unnamed protein product [Diamesa tonsa]